MADLFRILVYIPELTNRHRYVLGFVQGYFQGRASLHIYTGREEAVNAKHAGDLGISYSSENVPGFITIIPSGILESTGTAEIRVETAHYKDFLVLFPEKDTTSLLPFDLFGGVFYLLSRYEEYSDYIPDQHGRYPYTSSILWKEKALSYPVIDIWLNWLQGLASEKIPGRKPAIQLTMDVDHPFMIYGKANWKKIGLFVKGCLKGYKTNILGITPVKDPFNTIDKLRGICTRAGVEAKIFFLINNTGRFNGSATVADPGYAKMIRDAGNWSEIGLHPGYDSAENVPTIIAEKAAIEAILGKDITGVRQHFLRFRLPGFYRNLLAVNVKEDNSMGYAGTSGYRAGTSVPFLWYDIEKEQQTELKVYPFSWMDATFTYYHQGYTEADIEREIAAFLEHTKILGSDHCGIVHNDHLSEKAGFAPWERILRRIFSVDKMK